MSQGRSLDQTNKDRTGALLCCSGFSTRESTGCFLVAWILLSLTTFSVLGGCRARVLPFDDLDKCAPVSDELKQEILSQIAESNSRIASLRALIKGKVKHGIREDTFSQVVVFERPDKLRIELFATSMNRLTALVLTRGGRLHAVNPLERIVYRGTASKANMQRLLTVPFIPEEMMMWLSGRFILPEEDSQIRSRIHLCPDTSQAVMDLALVNGRTIRAVYRIDNTDLLMKNRGGAGEDQPALVLDSMEVRRIQEASLLVSRFFYDTRSRLGSGQVRMPSRLVFQLPEADISGVFVFKKGKVNPDLADQTDKLFEFKTPDGAKIIEIDQSLTENVRPLL